MTEQALDYSRACYSIAQANLRLERCGMHLGDTTGSYQRCCQSNVRVRFCSELSTSFGARQMANVGLTHYRSGPTFSCRRRCDAIVLIRRGSTGRNALRTCIVTDAKTQRVIVSRVVIADSYWSRFWGLMGRRTLGEDEGLLIEPCSSIHTMFMRFAIDVVFLDREHRVVKVATVPPFRAALGGGSHSVLEIPAGTAERNGVAVGDALSLTPLSDA